MVRKANQATTAFLVPKEIEVSLAKRVYQVLKVQKVMLACLVSLAFKVPKVTQDWMDFLVDRVKREIEVFLVRLALLV